MKDYKHLVNKNAREREQDFRVCKWDDNPKHGIPWLFAVAALILICVVGWAEESRADSDYNYYQSQQWLQRQQALEMMRRQEIMERNQQIQESRRGVDASIILDGTDNMPNYGESYIRGYELGRRYGR